MGTWDTKINGNDTFLGIKPVWVGWETKSLDTEIFQQVKKIIETGKDIERWKQSEADEKTLKSDRPFCKNSWHNYPLKEKRQNADRS